jgi:hypothetical protein
VKRQSRDEKKHVTEDVVGLLLGDVVNTKKLELDTVLILAAWPVLVLIYHILVLVGRYFGRYFEH